MPDNRRLYGVGFHLAVLGLCLTLPLLVLAVYSVRQTQEALDSANDERLLATATAISSNVDREITGMLDTLRALAVSPSLREGDFARFQNEAQRVIEKSKANILLVAPDMQQLVNTRVPYGTPLPKTSAPSAAETVFAGGRPFVSDLFLGQVSGHFVFNVLFPITTGDRVDYVLIMTSEPPRLTSLLQQQGLSDDWEAAILDRHRQIVAKLTEDTAAPSWYDRNLFVARMGERLGTFALTDAEGADWTIAYRRSNVTEWITAVQVPSAILNEQVDQFWRTLMAGTLAAVVLTVVLAFLFSRPIIHLVRASVAAAIRLGRKRPISGLPRYLREGQQLDDALHLAAEEIRTSEERLTLALDTVGMAFMELDLAQERTVYSPNFGSVFGFPPPLSPDIDEAWREFLVHVHDEDRQRLAELQKRAIEDGAEFESEYRIVKQDGEVMWVSVRCRTIADQKGSVVRVLETHRDMTETKNFEERLRLVMRELGHRAKNLMAVMTSIVTQTARYAGTVEEFSRDVNQRIQGLARSQDILMMREWKGGSLMELLRSHLETFGVAWEQRVSLDGPEIIMSPEATQSMGLALHELATNAVKYGALSVPSGKLEVDWSLRDGADGPRFEMVWKERDGPEAKQPERQGFGYTLIDRAIAASLSAEVELDFDRKGFTWRLSAPADQVFHDRVNASV